MEEPWFLISSADPSLDRVWSYAQRFCRGQLFRDQTSGSVPAGLRRQVDPHWKRGMSFLRIALAALQMAVAAVTAGLMAWLPIPLQGLEPCIPRAA